MSADLLALLDRDEAAGILAAADLRKQRTAAAQGFGHDWMAATAEHDEEHVRLWVFLHDRRADNDDPVSIAILDSDADLADEQSVGEHIAAEANPAHTLAAVRRWRGVAERHVRIENGSTGYCRYCYMSCRGWPCPDVLETVAEVRAYLGGAA